MEGSWSERSEVRIAFSCLCLSAGVLISKRTLFVVPLLPFVFVQAATTAALAWSAFLFKPRKVLPFQEFLKLCAPGFLQPGLNTPLFFAGATLVPLALASSLTSLETTFVLLLSFPLLGERLSRLGYLLALGSFAGLLLISWSNGSSAHSSTLGIALVIGSVFCASLDTLACRWLAPHSDAVTLTAACCTSGTALLAAALTMLPKQEWTGFRSAQVLGVTMLSGALIHGAGGYFFNSGLREVSASRTALILPVISILVGFGGFFLFAERLTGKQFLGGLIVILYSAAAGLLKTLDASDARPSD